MQSLIILRLLAIAVLGVMVSEANEHTYNKGCQKPTDVIFLLDASSSITEQDFRKHLDFVRNVIQDLGPSMVRSGLVTYGDQDRLEFGLQTYSSAETAMKAASVKNQLRGGTRTDLALRRMSQMMADDKRPGATQVGVVLTDGLSDYPADTKVEVEMAREAGIGLFAVGVGDEVDADELMTIAKTKDHLFRIHSASDLDSLKNALWRSICSHSEQQQHAVENNNNNNNNNNNTRASTEGEGKVAGDPMDLTFLLDTSIESFPENMEGRRRFVNDCLSHLPGSKDNARVSVITFGNLAQIQLDVKAHSSLRDVRLAFEGIGMRSARTDVANALSILRSSSEEKHRKQSKKAAVIVTAGRVGDPQSAKSEASKLMNEKGVAIFVVGVGPDVDRSELESISSNSSGQAVLIIESYQELETIASKLVKTISTHTQASFSPTPETKRYTKQPSARNTRVSAPNIFADTPTPRPVQATTPVYSPSSTHRPIDIVFAHPCSLGQTDTRHATEFIIVIGEQLGFDGKTIRIGVTPRLCPPHAQAITVDEGSSMADQLRRAMDHRLLAANHSDIVSQLRHLNDVSFNEQQMSGRSDAVKMAVVFFEPTVVLSDEVTVEVNRLRSIPIVLVGVSVGQRNDESRRGLEGLTSCEKCLLHTESYADLNDQLLDRLADIVMEHRIIREVAGDYDY